MTKVKERLEFVLNAELKKNIKEFAKNNGLTITTVLILAITKFLKESNGKL